MPKYTTSYSMGRKPKRAPRFRKNDSNILPSGRVRKQRKRGARYLRHSQGFGGSGSRYGKRRNARRPYAIIVVGCALLVFLASILWYANRGVDITLNGQTVSVPIHSSIDRVIEDEGLEPSPGRLLAVDDSVLKKDGGDRCSVTLNGKKVAVDKLSETELTGGEELEITDGEDTYEPHQVKATTLEPSLSVEGTGAIAYVQTWGVAGRKEVWTGETSGKTKDRGVVKEKVDCVVMKRSVRPDDEGKKYVALTFDEGPGPETEAILKALEDGGAKATFFLQGDAAEANPDAVAKIAAAGHEIGSNGYSDTNLTTLSGDDLRSQLTRGFSAIEEAGGGSVALLRPPSGLFSDENWAQAMDLVSAVVTWNLDSGDWTLQGADVVVDTVVGSVQSGNIVLLTDNQSTSAQTAEALPSIIRQLKDEGYELVTLSDLIATDEDLAKEVSLSKVSMPKDATLPQVTKESDNATDE